MMLWQVCPTRALSRGTGAARYFRAAAYVSARRIPAKSIDIARKQPVVGKVEETTHEPPISVRIPSISRPILFCVGFAAASFTAAALYSRKQTEEAVAHIRTTSGVFSNLSSFFSQEADDSEQRIMAARKHITAERLGGTMKTLVGTCHAIGLPDNVTHFIGHKYLSAAESYLNLSTGQQVVVPVIAVNTLVFLTWAVASPVSGLRRRLWHGMNTHFVHAVASARSYTMLTSTFSHKGFLHYGFNNYALWTIGGSALVYSAAQHGASVAEASHTPQFLAFFATAGVFAATVSQIASSLRMRRIVSKAIPDMNRFAAAGLKRSLGSSGAVYAALVMSACTMPDARVSLIFLPMFSLPIGVGVLGLVGVDVLGILLQWQTLDHWAHLGGALFGYLYYHYGAELWSALRQRFSVRKTGLISTQLVR